MRARRTKRFLGGLTNLIAEMRKDLESHVRGVLKVFGICMKSVETGKLRRGFRDQLAAVADTDPAIAMMAEVFIPLHKTLCIARDALDDEVRTMARKWSGAPTDDGSWPRAHRGVGIYRDTGR